MLDSLTLDQMRVFAAVVEAGSFRAAAARLQRVQSAVSHAIANLEGQLQTELFDRSAHRPVLTSAGQALLSDVEAILTKVDALRARARGFGDGVEPSISLALDAVFPLEIAAAALADFNAVFPTVAVRVSVLTMGGPLEALLEGRHSLAVTADKVEPARIERVALGDLPPFVAVAGARHPLAEAPPGGMWDAVHLADHLQVVVEDFSQINHGQDFGVLSPSRWRVGDLPTKHALIRAGVGWGNLPLWMVAEDLAAGRLVRVPAAGLNPDATTPLRAWLAWRIDAPPGPAARALCDGLASALAMAQP